MKGLNPEDHGPGYLTGDVAKMLGVNPRRVEGWIEQGFLVPAVPGKGPGHRNLFSLEQVILGALILEIQANFGEKSALVGRFFQPGSGPRVLKLMRDWEAKAEDFIVAISSKAGEPRPLLGLMPKRSTQRYLDEHLAKARTVTFINWSAIAARFTPEKRG
jgi:hypothetical protein